MDTPELSLSALSSPAAVRFVLDQMPFGVLFLDTELRIVAANAFLRARLPAELRLEAKPPVATILDPGDTRSLEIFRQTLEQGQPVTLSTRIHRDVFRLVPLPGTALGDIPQSVTILPLTDNQRISGLTVVVQDVSDRVLAEAELNREIGKLAFLHELDLALSTLEPSACMQTLMARLRQLIKADVVSLLLLKDGRLEIVAAEGRPLTEPAQPLDPLTGITGWVVHNRQSVNIPDVRQDARYVQIVESTRSEMAAPLIANDECLGVINLESDAPGAFTQDNLDLLEMVAFSAATALYNAQTHAESNYWRTYYQSVLNQTGDVIYTVDRDLRLTSVNYAWDTFARGNDGAAWLAPACIGRRLVDAFTGAERQKWETLCAELLLGARSDYHEDFSCHGPDAERWLALRAAPLLAASGAILGIMFSTHDVSEHVAAERRLRAVNTQLEAMLGMSQVLSQNLPNQNIPQVTVEMLADMLQADCVTITGFDTQALAFQVIAAHGASERHIREFVSPQASADKIISSHGHTAALYQLTEPSRVPNQPIYQADQLHGVLYSLIEHQGKVIGSLNIFTRNPQRRFSGAEQELVRALTPQIGLAMTNARLYEQLQNLATTDSLTGLVNRRLLDDLLAREVERGKRHRRAFVLLMVDLDHFKCYNDTFGHAMGDELLMKIAQLFKHALRAGDIAARYGGDEFVLILPETNLEDAAQIAARLQATVATVEVPHLESVKCRKLTLSIGIAVYPYHADEAAGLLRCADQALYRAKQSGRNRVAVHAQNLKSQLDAARIGERSAPEGKMYKILIVDDSAFARATLRKMLRDAGYEVDEASSGFEALELMPTIQPDLVTMDLLMPGMEGEELLGHMQKLAANCPFVVISADAQAVTRQALLAAGAAGFLNKPVTEADLLPLMHSLLEQRRAGTR